MDNRYFIKECISPDGFCYLVKDRHHPDYPVATCTDDMKAELICHLLNESWDKARNRGPAHD